MIVQKIELDAAISFVCVAVDTGKKVVSNNRKYQNTTCKYLEMCTIKIDTAIELAEEKNNYC